MSVDLGDRKKDTIIYFMWSTNASDGSSITRELPGTIWVYKNDLTTPIRTGITNVGDFDTLTGIHHCRIDLTAHPYYTAQDDFMVVLAGATIDGKSVNAVLATFSIENRTASVNNLESSALDQINAVCDTALEDYNAPTSEEATADKDEIIAKTTGDKDEIIAKTTGGKDEIIAKTTGDKDEIIAKTTGDKDEIIAKTTGDKDEIIAKTTGDKDEIIAKTTGDKDEIIADTNLIRAKTDNLPSGMAKGVAVPKFDLFMVLASDHVSEAIGATVDGSISKDGGTFAPLTNPVSEVSNGVYTIAAGLTAEERDADVSTLRFIAVGCDDRVITIIST